MEWIELGEVADVSSGQTAPQRSTYYDKEGIAFVRAGNLKDLSEGKDLNICDKLKIEVGEELGLKLYSSGTIVFAKSGMSCLKSYIYMLEKESFVVNHLACLIVHEEKIIPKYLKYVLEFRKPKELINDTSYPSIRISDIRKFKIPVPSLAIQEQIVEVLDRAQELIDKRRAQLEAMDSLIESIFYSMFGDPVKNEKGWEVKELGEFGAWSSGGTPSRKNKEYFQGEIYWYTAGELNYRYTKESEEKITLEAVEQSSAKIFKAGSLFVGMYDSAAFKLSILSKDASSNQACANLLPNENYNVEWLYDLFRIMKPTYLSRRQGVRQKNLSQGMIKSFEAISPPLDLQNEFAQKVEVIEREKEVLEESLELMEENYSSIMDRAFKGQLFN